MDDVIAHCSKFGECEPLDWLGEGDLNEVPLGFRCRAAVTEALKSSQHYIVNDRGRKIRVTAERIESCGEVPELSRRLK